MDRHQFNLVVIFPVVRIGIEGDILKIGLECIVLLLVLVLVKLDGLDKLLKILQPLLFGVGTVFREEPARLEKPLKKRRYAHTA